jgi:hypothetical protein
VELSFSLNRKEEGENKGGVDTWCLERKEIYRSLILVLSCKAGGVIY